MCNIVATRGAIAEAPVNIKYIFNLPSFFLAIYITTTPNTRKSNANNPTKGKSLFLRSPRSGNRKIKDRMRMRITIKEYNIVFKDGFFFMYK